MADSYDMYRFLSAQGQMLDAAQVEALMDRGIEHVHYLWPVMTDDAVFYTLCRQPSLIDNERSHYARKQLRDILAAHMTPALIAQWFESRMSRLRWLSWVFDPTGRPLASAGLRMNDLANNLLAWPPSRKSPRWAQDDLSLRAHAILQSRLDIGGSTDERYIPPAPFKTSAYDKGDFLVVSMPGEVLKASTYAKRIGMMPHEVSMALLLHPETQWAGLLPRVLDSFYPALDLSGHADRVFHDTVMTEVLPALPARWPNNQALPDLGDFIATLEKFSYTADPQRIAKILIAWRELQVDYLVPLLPFVVNDAQALSAVFEAVQQLREMVPHQEICRFPQLLQHLTLQALYDGFRQFMAGDGERVYPQHAGALLRELALRPDTDWAHLARLIAASRIIHPDLAILGKLFPGVGFPGVLPVYEKAVSALDDPAQAWLVSTYGEVSVAAIPMVRALSETPVDAARLLEGLLEKLPYQGDSPLTGPEPVCATPC